MMSDVDRTTTKVPWRMRRDLLDRIKFHCEEMNVSQTQWVSAVIEAKLDGVNYVDAIRKRSSTLHEPGAACVAYAEKWRADHGLSIIQYPAAIQPPMSQPPAMVQLSSAQPAEQPPPVQPSATQPIEQSQVEQPVATSEPGGASSPRRVYGWVRRRIHTRLL